MCFAAAPFKALGIPYRGAAAGYDEDGELHTLGLLEQLRAESSALWRAASDFHFRVDAMMRQLENPNLHDIQNMSYWIDL
jgi:hypothetical protein